MDRSGEFPDQPHADRSCRVSSTLSDAAGFAQPQGTCSADDGGHIRGNSTSGCCDPLWLPSEVTVQVVFNGDGFHNEHRYTNYERFRVSSKIVAH